MRSLALPRFWACYHQLPPNIQEQADKAYTLFSNDPFHPSLRFKQIGPFWSVRVSYSYRALAVRDGETVTWFWIGTHSDYDKLLNP